MTEGKDFVRLEMNFVDGKPFDVEQLPNIVLPEIPQRKDLVIGSSNKETSGPIINYVAASIAQTYAHEVPSISFYQPQIQGYTVGITHDPNRLIGDLIPESEVIKDLESQISEKSSELVSTLKELTSAGSKNIDSVVGKNGQIQQNISAHKKQADEIIQNKNCEVK